MFSPGFVFSLSYVLLVELESLYPDVNFIQKLAAARVLS